MNAEILSGDREREQGGKEWPILKKCSSARQLIVVVYMIRTVETAKTKLPKEHNLKKHRKTGNVPYAEPVKNVFGLYAARDLLLRRVNKKFYTAVNYGFSLFESRQISVQES
jgi:hypothetical protein